MADENNAADAVNVMPVPVTAEAVIVVVSTFSSLNGGHVNVTVLNTQLVAA